jgi:hypothetical protein
MTPKERFRATCRFEPVDRPFRWETIGYWPLQKRAPKWKLVKNRDFPDEPYKALRRG